MSLSFQNSQMSFSLEGERRTEHTANECVCVGGGDSVQEGKGAVEKRRGEGGVGRAGGDRGRAKCSAVVGETG